MKEGSVTSVAFSPDGRTIAAGYRDVGAAAAWCCGTSASRGAWPTSRSPCRRATSRSVAFSPDGKALAAGYGGVGDGGGVVLWDVARATAPAGRSRSP